MFGTPDERFTLGQTVATPAAIEAAQQVFLAPQIGFMELLSRHITGDWGEVGPEDARANEAALKFGTRLVSAYTVNDIKFWVITEADRSVTTILLPEEY
jgi:hypothetical protein